MNLAETQSELESLFSNLNKDLDGRIENEVSERSGWAFHNTKSIQLRMYQKFLHLVGPTLSFVLTTKLFKTPKELTFFVHCGRYWLKFSYKNKSRKYS